MSTAKGILVVIPLFLSVLVLLYEFMTLNLFGIIPVYYTLIELFITDENLKVLFAFGLPAVISLLIALLGGGNRSG